MRVCALRNPQVGQLGHVAHVGHGFYFISFQNSKTPVNSAKQPIVCLFVSKQPSFAEVAKVYLWCHYEQFRPSFTRQVRMLRPRFLSF